MPKYDNSERLSTVSDQDWRGNQGDRDFDTLHLGTQIKNSGVVGPHRCW